MSEEQTESSGGFDADSWASEHVVAEAPDPLANIDFGPDPEPAYEAEQPYEPEPDYGDRSTPDVSQEARALRQMLDAPEDEPDGVDAEFDLEEEDGYQADDLDDYGDDEASFDPESPEYAVQALALTAQQADQDLDAQREQLSAERQTFEAQQHADALGGLVQRYPAMQTPAVQQALRDELAPLAEQFGDVRASPHLIEMAFLATRARETMAREVRPAQIPKGAFLETGAGATTPGSEDPDAQLKRDLLTPSGGGVID
ncbi:MAG: hypothetical protein GEU88_00690 [Solirubrobacterales bacterium]|nr:hypothetical protein [Solirubrobacterales bacterium]